MWVLLCQGEIVIFVIFKLREQGVELCQSIFFYFVFIGGLIYQVVFVCFVLIWLLMIFMVYLVVSMLKKFILMMFFVLLEWDVFLMVVSDQFLSLMVKLLMNFLRQVFVNFVFIGVFIIRLFSLVQICIGFVMRLSLKICLLMFCLILRGILQVCVCIWF